ncbi:MAG: DNA alkylation repair protein, partial [Clostridia bacterium]|nr:DNA alkylation repair protein [Clostridia bacterium]
RMMVAWFFATALTHQYEAALPYLTEHRLPLWIHNKTVQKACESYRIPPEAKRYLRSLRRTKE